MEKKIYTNSVNPKMNGKYYPDVRNTKLFLQFGKTLLFLTILLFSSHLLKGQVSSASISFSTACPGSAQNVDFIMLPAGDLPSNNMELYLSDIGGATFSQPAITIQPSETSPLSGTLPANLAAGTYRFRVNSTNPAGSALTSTFTVPARDFTSTFTFNNPSNPGNTVSASVSLSPNCPFNSGNSFFLELSDKTGNFSATGYPKQIDSELTVNGTTLSGTLPNVPYGTAYKLRVRSTNPVNPPYAKESTAFAINPTIFTTACVCNNNQTPNIDDGTYAVTLYLKNSDDTPMNAGLTFRIVTTGTSGLLNSGGGPLGNPVFTYCDGFDCPAGVSAGQYYLRVNVTNPGTYSASVDGPDSDNLTDFSLASTNCGTSTLYPDLPLFPATLLDRNCLVAGTNTFTNSSLAVFSENNTLTNPVLPEGFSQTVTDDTLGGNLFIDNDNINEADNDPFYELYLIKQATNGCRVSSFKEFKVFKEVLPNLVDISLFCRPKKDKDSISLTIMQDSTNLGGGTFSIPGVTIVDNKVAVGNGICYQVTYSVTDSCGVVKTDTKSLQVTIKPKPSFVFDAGQPTSPVCATAPVTINVTRTSTGPNPVFSVSSNNTSFTPTIVTTATGATLTLPNPGPGVNVIYKIQLIESNNSPAVCGSIPTPTNSCTDTIYKNFVVYQDLYDCGANNLFTSTCDAYEPALCPISTSPSLDFGCKFFTIEGPDILTSEITLNQGVLSCTDTELTGSFNVSLFGIDANALGGGQTIGSFPGISTVCRILNFKILGWRPLGALYNLLGCNKTIAQFILGLISNLAGGDGGGYIVMADTDGDGGFDYLVDDGFFPSGEKTFSIPNRVKGAGYVSIRAVGGWVNSPSDVCGNLDIEGINLLDLLPIGAIPIVGAVLEDILATAGCGVNLAFSVEATESVQVNNTSPPNFINCNTGGYIFAQTLDCTIPVNWSVPVAIDGCSGEHIEYKGVLTPSVNYPTIVNLYAGTNPPAQFTSITSPGIYQTAGPVPGSMLLPGTYTVTYTAVSCNGNPATCSFEVKVTPGTPILECPKNITVRADVGKCTARVNGLAPYQGVGCASIINYSYTKPVSNTVVATNSTVKGTHNIPDGHEFELGTTTITYQMLVDINGDNDYADTGETQTCSFTVTVIDDQEPHAVCLDVEIQLNNEGLGTVYATGPDSIYVDGGSTDNCGDVSILLSKDNTNYFSSLNFSCEEKGQNVVNVQVTDDNDNVSYCKSVVKVLDFFEGFKLDLDVPEVCFEPFQNTYDFSPYIVIATPDGDNIQHANVGTLGPEVAGAFGISAFLPDPGSTNDPGTMTTDGVYTLGTGTGWITFSYILSINEQVNQIDDTSPLTGCYRMVHDVFRVEKLDPVWKGGYMCCDQDPVWLGGASWDGITAPPIPAGMISLTDIRGDYPGDVYGEWTGQGVTLVNPDGTLYSGDEYYQFDPGGLDGTYTLTYTIGDEPCIFTYSQDIRVTCQDLHVELSDFTTCPANWVEERVVYVNLDDKDLVVSTSGFDDLAADGAHYGNGPALDPVQDLVDVPVVDGRVVIPGFYAPAVRNKDYEICVTAYQTTPFGCTDIFCYTITVQDLLSPEFQNCPKEPIVVDSPTDICASFVNFEYPWALDNCMGVNSKTVQVDLTGLVSGDLFPVGLTVLAYTATDTVGNQSYCELKIIVNDYHTPPNIDCPDNVEKVNDLNDCGAIVYGIAPAKIEDNCPDNLAVIYEVRDNLNKVIGCGFEDASGDFFPVGNSSVKYKVVDQPLVLITEIVQDGLTTGIEVTNFGPAAIDLTCATFSLKNPDGTTVESFMVPTRNNKSTYGTSPIYPPDPVVWVLPNPNIIPVGGTFTHTFDTNPASGTKMKYCFSFLDRIIDETVINDKIIGDVILRKSICDNDDQFDFIAATPCDPGSFGLINPGLPTMTPNGTTTALQNYAPLMDMCIFNVNIIDLEAPSCIQHDSVTISNAGTVPINENTCMLSAIYMPGGLVDDVNIHDLRVAISNAGALTAYLNSPSGTRIKLFDSLCYNQPNVDVTLDQTIVWTPAPGISTALCNPLGHDGIYSPKESFKAFYGEQALGEWTLEIYTSGNVTGTLNNWDLEILYQLPYDQPDVVLENAPGLCDTTFTWIHPILEDNCCKGEVTVTYSYLNTVNGEKTSETAIISNDNGTINVQGLSITKTFKVGITTIEYLLTDQYGNTHTCGFTVTVNDTEQPVFVNGCPDQTVYLEPTKCFTVLPVFPEVTDNCELENISFYDEFGDLIDVYHLKIGVNKIYDVATDIYGNQDTCIFNVNVIEFIPMYTTMACNDNVSISLDADCEAELHPDMLLEGNNYRCYDNYCIEILDEEGNLHENAFDYNDVGHTFMVTISDCLGSGNNCMSIVNIVEKYEPEIVCPSDTIIVCNASINPDNLGYVSILNCEPFAKIEFEDDFKDNGLCGKPRAEIIRTWIVDDQQGNIVSCDQKITIKKTDLADVVPPSDVLDLECKTVNQHPDAVLPVKTGYPTVGGIPVNENFGICMFSYLYTDEIYHYCGNSYVILRTWKVYDECEPVSNTNPRIFVQKIRVFDTEPPVFHECKDIVIEASPYNCNGSIEIPLPMVSDYCNDFSLKVEISDAVLKVTGNYFAGNMKILAYNMPLGNHGAKFIARDACNNKSVCKFNIKVIDKSPPVAVCEQYKQVALTASGEAKVFAKDYDSGSFDNCNPVWFKALRVNADLVYDGGCEELNGDDNVKTSPMDVWYDDEVYFCCDDLGNQVMISMRVFDVNPGVGPVAPDRMLPGGDLYGHYNECWNMTSVECKIPPVLTCPPVEITCEESLDPNDNPKLWPEVVYVCNFELEYKDSRDNSTCGANITRTWTATGCGQPGSCKQTIKVVGTTPFDPCTIVFPADVQTHCTNDLTDGGKPTWDEYPCNVVTTEIIREDTFKFVDGACYKIIREWAVIDWCVFKPNTGANMNVDEVTSARKFNCNKLVKDGYYRYTQILKVTDLIPPVITVDNQCIGITDCYAYNVEMKATASDTCNTNEEFWWKYIVVNMDTWETVQVSYNYIPKPQGVTVGKRSEDKLDKVKEAKLVIQDPLPTGNYRVTWTTGDGCGNATSKDQYFTVADKKAPTPVMVDIATAVMENGMVELKARWFDKGGCGDGCISSWDNCTPQSGLFFTFTPMLPDLSDNPAKWAQQLAQYGRNFFDPATGAISTEAKYLAGTAHAWYPESRSSSRVFLCSYVEEDDTYSTVKIYVWDQFSLDADCDDRNYDYANVIVNFNHCGSAVIAGQTKYGQNGFAGMTVTCSNDEESFIKLTEQDGKYEFEVYPGEYNIKSFSDDNYLAGISTLDILLIQKYILGLKQITDPSVLLAADVNMNDKITASDILELRKTLLGITNKFTNNSWIGISAGYEFTNPENANEESSAARHINVIIDRNQSVNGLDFNVIKIGDLNKSYQHIEGRGSQSVKFILDDRYLDQNEIVEIPVYAKDFTSIFGCQFTLDIEGLKVIELKSGAISISHENYNIRNNKFLFSWNNSDGISVPDNEILFTLIVQSEKNADISTILKLSDKYVRTEAYVGEDLEIRNITIEFNGSQFALHQNQPNPFTKETIIRFNLPVSEEYTLSIFDVNGKEIYSQNLIGKSGINSVEINNLIFDAGGVYYYILTSGDDTATKKMIYFK
jgi:subtilisin-like proprotein convertase family protein